MRALAVFVITLAAIQVPYAFFLSTVSNRVSSPEATPRNQFSGRGRRIRKAARLPHCDLPLRQSTRTGRKVTVPLPSLAGNTGSMDGLVYRTGPLPKIRA